MTSDRERRHWVVCTVLEVRGHKQQQGKRRRQARAKKGGACYLTAPVKDDILI
jgi:hypothetical protein